jgi:hypothetical protein
MLHGPFPADDALTLAVVVEKLPFGVAQHWTCVPVHGRSISGREHHVRLKQCGAPGRKPQKEPRVGAGLEQGHVWGRELGQQA